MKRTTTGNLITYFGLLQYTVNVSLNIVEEEIFLENDDDLQLNAAMKSYS